MRGHGIILSPVLQCSVCGKMCQQVSSMLGSVISVKQTQLHIAATWPTCRNLREEKRVELDLLKHSMHTDQVVCTWPYFAGFFDAKGCISIRGPCNSYSLRVAQNTHARPVVDSEFLENAVARGQFCPLQSRQTRIENVANHRSDDKNLRSADASSKRVACQAASGRDRTEHHKR
eukprot:gnl/MRDRNA2_/MRDRNA2_41622_c0_seq1.p1 gnl/MRDRNA2_/MRDRNA2_41622_c0~~gnl/MRDRNA2_/MRDRNA2_41622_c0_seq1.p1  ORF type:complete len:175 (+),score=21.23 gnl/MRDRNA2_/MRDRNA2_41622_c0_seq1:246-770(+)